MKEDELEAPDVLDERRPLDEADAEGRIQQRTRSAIGWSRSGALSERFKRDSRVDRIEFELGKKRDLAAALEAEVQRLAERDRAPNALSTSTTLGSNRRIEVGLGDQAGALEVRRRTRADRSMDPT